MQETQETQVPSLGQEGPLEEGMATDCSVLAWRIPQAEEPGGLHRVTKSRTRLSDLAGAAKMLQSTPHQISPCLNPSPASTQTSSTQTSLSQWQRFQKWAPFSLPAPDDREFLLLSEDSQPRFLTNCWSPASNDSGSVWLKTLFLESGYNCQRINETRPDPIHIVSLLTVMLSDSGILLKYILLQDKPAAATSFHGGACPALSSYHPPSLPAMVFYIFLLSHYCAFCPLKSYSH